MLSEGLRCTPKHARAIAVELLAAHLRWGRLPEYTHTHTHTQLEILQAHWKCRGGRGHAWTGLSVNTMQHDFNNSGTRGIWFQLTCELTEMHLLGFLPAWPLSHSRDEDPSTFGSVNSRSALVSKSRLYKRFAFFCWDSGGEPCNELAFKTVEELQRSEPACLDNLSRDYLKIMAGRNAKKSECDLRNKTRSLLFKAIRYWYKMSRLEYLTEIYKPQHSKSTFKKDPVQNLVPQHWCPVPQTDKYWVAVPGGGARTEAAISCWAGSPSSRAGLGSTDWTGGKTRLPGQRWEKHHISLLLHHLNPMV